MTLHKRTSKKQPCRNTRFDMRWVLSIVLSLAVIWAQSAPVMAGHGPSGSANWVEICADGGSYFIQVGEDGQKQKPECACCDFCLLPSVDTPDAHSALLETSVLSDFTTISYSTDLSALPDSPEQYWSACRGPPIASVENNMTTPISLFSKESADVSLNTWVISCV